MEKCLGLSWAFLPNISKNIGVSGKILTLSTGKDIFEKMFKNIGDKGKMFGVFSEICSKSYVIALIIPMYMGTHFLKDLFNNIGRETLC